MDVLSMSEHYSLDVSARDRSERKIDYLKDFDTKVQILSFFSISVIDSSFARYVNDFHMKATSVFNRTLPPSIPLIVYDPRHHTQTSPSVIHIHALVIRSFVIGKSKMPWTQTSESIYSRVADSLEQYYAACAALGAPVHQDFFSLLFALDIRYCSTTQTCRPYSSVARRLPRPTCLRPPPSPMMFLVFLPA